MYHRYIFPMIFNCYWTRV